MKFCRICDAPTHGQANYCDDCRWQTRISARAYPSIVPLSTPHDFEVYKPIRDVYGDMILQWNRPFRNYCYGWQKRKHLA